MVEDKSTQFIVRHRKLLHDWSKVIVICDDFREAQETVVQIMNMSIDIAEVSMYSQISGTTSTYSPRYENGDRVPLLLEEVR